MVYWRDVPVVWISPSDVYLDELTPIALHDRARRRWNTGAGGEQLVNPKRICSYILTHVANWLPSVTGIVGYYPSNASDKPCFRELVLCFPS